MSEIIKSIKSVDDYKVSEDEYYGFEGYFIETSDQTIFIGISNGASCCEQFGYFITNDDFEDFIGAELEQIDIVNKALNKQKIDDKFEYGLDEGGIMFVNLETSKGTLQLTTYNAHNGYYGHTSVVISKQLNHKECL